MSKEEIERARRACEVERLDEEAGVLDLAASTATQEAAKLLLDRPSPPLGLLLERSKRSEVAVCGEDVLDGAAAERTDELVLEIHDTYEEAELLHLATGEPGAEADALEAAAEVALLAGVAEAGHLDSTRLRADERQDVARGLRATDRENQDSFPCEIASPAFGQGLESDAVADALDEDDRRCFEARCRCHRSKVQASQRSDERSTVALTQYYTATTLDGYIADPNHSLEWLFGRDQDQEGVLSYGAFVSGVGAVAMGSTTYEWILDQELARKDPSKWNWPYDVPSWVFTHRELRVVPKAEIRFTSAPVAEAHAEMVAAAGGRNVWIAGGGDLAGQFADAGLLDEVIVYVAPVTLGLGAPLLPRRLELRLEETGRNGDFVAARYSVVGPLA